MLKFIKKFKVIYLITFLLLAVLTFVFRHDTFATHSNIDTLNLAEDIPAHAMPYLLIGLEDAWDKINNSEKNLSRAIVGIIDSGYDFRHPEFRGTNSGSTPGLAKTDFIDVPKIVKLEIQAETEEELDAKIQIIEDSENELIIAIAKNVLANESL